MFTSIAKGFESFKGVSSTLVFDNAKAQVTRADKFDADLNSEFSLFCEQNVLRKLSTFKMGLYISHCVCSKI